MKQFGIIGLGKFGRRMVDELLKADVELLILDKNPEVVELFKNRVAAAYVADALNEETIRQTIPQDIDTVIVDTVDNMDVSILVTHYLRKIGIREIIAVAGTDQHGEIMEAVGATRVIYPNKEAALRIAPTLVSSALFNYFPIAENIALAELKPPEKVVGMSLIESDLRNVYGITVIAVREQEHESFSFVSGTYRLQPEDTLLVVAPGEVIEKMSHVRLSGGHTVGSKAGRGERPRGPLARFKRVFSRR